MPELLLVLRIVLAALLYGFLGLAFYVVARDLQQRAKEMPQAYPAASLIVEAETQPEQSFALRPITAIGRNRDNHVIIDDPFASGNHAIVTWRDSAWWVEDLESHNGTYLNDQRIAKPQLLVHGDRIRIGETVLRFHNAAR